MARARKFGAFAGVFTPSILTILGVIMYLRLPSIVGQAGLWATIGIITVAHVISICTGLSVASIATDKKVEAGGTYYMLSRSLGLPIGGTLGLALFVGLSFSVSLYVIGFSESFLGFWGLGADVDSIRVTGTVTLAAVATITLISTALALKAQFYILAAIALSLLSILFGRHDMVPAEPLLEPLASAAPFIVLFGIFFPAVTGFEAGVSMSGDLKDPKRDIPRGTITAIVVGFVVYVALAAFFSFTVDSDALTSNPNVLTDMALFAPFVVAGIWGATISSALGSILGAPRILQATATDRITPAFFGRGYGVSNEPRNALIATVLIAEAGILIGELDVIARVVSMFFITTYGFLNLSCAIEKWASPDFRPDFSVPAWVSVLGSLACFVVMIQLDLIAMVAATVVLGVVYLALTRRQLRLASGDTWEGVWSSLVRTGLHRLDRRGVHARNWRPNLIVFATDEAPSEPLADVGHWLAYRRGIVSTFEFHADGRPGSRAISLSDTTEVEAGDPVGTFRKRMECQDVYEGMEMVSRYYGFSGIDPNAALLAWPGPETDLDRFVRVLDTLGHADLNILLLDHDPSVGFGDFRRVDIWLENTGRNPELAIALIRYLAAADAWRAASLRFLAVNRGESSMTGLLKKGVADFIDLHRVEGVVQVVSMRAGESLSDLVRRESTGADLTLIGIPETLRLEDSSFARDVSSVIEGIGSVLLLRASSFFPSVRLSAVDPDDPAAEVPAFESELAPVDFDEEPTRELAGPLSGLRDRYTLWAQAEMQGLPTVLAPGMALLAEVTGAVEQTADALEREGSEAVATRRMRAIRRMRGQLLHRARQAASKASESLPRAEAELIHGRLTEGLEDLGRMVDALPDARWVTLSSEVLNGSAADSFRVRWARRMARWRARVRRAEPGHTVRMAGLGQEVMNQHLESTLLGEVDRLQGATGGVAEAVLDLVSRSAAFLDALSGDPSAEPEKWAHTADMMREVAETATARSHAVLESLGTSWSRTLAETGRAVLNEIHDRARAPGRGRPLGERAADQRARSSRRVHALERCQDWEEVQTLRLNALQLDLGLLVARHRARTSVERTVERTVQDVRGSTVAALEKLEHELADPKTDPEHWQRRIAEIPMPVYAKDTVSEIVSEVREILAELPGTLSIPGDATADAGTTAGQSEPMALSPRRVAEFQVHVTLVAPIEEELRLLESRLLEAVETAGEVVRLMGAGAGAAGELSLEEGAELRGPAMKRIRESRDAVERCLGALEGRCAEALVRVDDSLTAYGLATDASLLDRQAQRGRRLAVFARGREGLRRAVESLNQNAVSLFYQRSRGVLTGRSLASRGAESTLPERLLGAKEAVSPSTHVLESLPVYYRQLFLGTPILTRDLRVGLGSALQRAEQIINRFHTGLGGGMLIVGDPGSGRSTLAQLAVQRFVRPDRVATLRPPPGGSSDPEVLRHRVGEALGAVGLADETLASLPSGWALVVDDAELWWERSSDGSGALETLLGWIDTHGDRCLFIVVLGSPAYGFLRRFMPLEERFLGTLVPPRLSAAQLEALIMARHTATGLRFSISDRDEDELGALRRARLFDQLFGFSGGVPGAALAGWVGSVREVEGGTLEIDPVSLPGLDVIDALSPTQRGVLSHLLVHRVLTLERLVRIEAREASQVEEDLALLRRGGWVYMDRQGLLSVDRYLLPHLCREFTERGIL